MKRNARKAFTALKKIGAPVIASSDSENGHFVISGEDNYPETWADFYEGPLLEKVLDNGEIEWAFGVNPKITRILNTNRLMCEWINGGMLGVYDG